MSAPVCSTNSWDRDEDGNDKRIAIYRLVAHTLARQGSKMALIQRIETGLFCRIHDKLQMSLCSELSTWLRFSKNAVFFSAAIAASFNQRVNLTHKSYVPIDTTLLWACYLWSSATRRTL